ncbi:uncharacterized protein RCC_02765 [Ramularia collo-cygni]|uniref:Required for respiratory growth protein 9, mitochondrial n=1 Tax=Ramularia collo-cygni TaxID=112498 RepID=A0A2D3UP26_9PEZI|nr:uncharacterized protein RCC_02765 [Ramularia collo-cygni]CZT16931.1 uncharacterized protein RCC_02765 [Ramularia collo-cygni]
MYRCMCSCSTRALEAFVADIAGINIKSRPRAVHRATRALHSGLQTDRTVDSISLQRPVSDSSASDLRMIELAPVLEPVSNKVETERLPAEKGDGNADASSTRTKAENRMLRKLKRIQGGAHNKHGSDSGKLVDQVQSMLQKIEESPEILGGLVKVKKEEPAKTEKNKVRRGRSFDGKAKWVKGKQERFNGRSTKVRKEGSKGPSGKARKESIMEHNANLRAGEETVDVGDEATWEHVQDEWTEQPKWQPIEARETTQTTRGGKNAGKKHDVDDSPSKEDAPAKPQEPWGIQKSALERKFGQKGWQPRKRLSPDTLSGIRALHASNPTIYNVEMLRDHFKITPEAIRRILKSKWQPSTEEIEDRMKRWEKRGVKKWSEMAEQGQKPPKKWRMLGVPNPKLGQKKEWNSNSGVAKKEKTEERIVREEGLLAKSRRLEKAQRARFTESLTGRIL